MKKEKLTRNLRSWISENFLIPFTAGTKRLKRALKKRRKWLLYERSPTTWLPATVPKGPTITQVLSSCASQSTWGAEAGGSQVWVHLDNSGRSYFKIKLIKGLEM
jgi:hypothetical protein